MTLRRPYKYVLVGQTPVAEPDPIKWAEWFENTENRFVARDEIGATVVSTIFLGIDTSFGGTPVLFETMVFTDGDPDERFNRRRCCTWLEAEAMHKSMVSAVKGNQTCPS